MTGSRKATWPRTVLAAAMLTVARSLDPRRPGGRMPLTGLVAAVFSAAGFVVVWMDVGSSADLAAVDRPVWAWLVSQRGGWLDLTMRTVTTLGAIWSVIVLGALGAVFAALRTRRPWPLVLVTVALSGAGIGIVLIKHLVGRVRPPGASQLVDETGLSFPSGHTLGATVAFGVLGYLGVRLARGWWDRVLTVVLAVAVVAAVGVSRMYLGVHWLTDVVGGWLLGGAWLFACLTVAHIVTAATHQSCIEPSASRATGR